jgi:F420-dependent oxidoreductase-like protein
MLGDYNNVRRIWVEADKLGFHSGWLFDHLFELPLFGPLHEPCLEAWTLLSALSKETNKMRLGVTCLCVSYRNPAMLAKMSSTLDVISGGRFELGIGSGWAKTEHQSYGIPFENPRQRTEKLEEAVMIIKKMWTEENPSFKGKHYRIDGAVCQPKPIQKPRPLIWIGGGGERFTLMTVAKHADGCNFIGLSVDEYRHKLDVLAEHCETIGRKIGDVRKSWQGSIIIGRDDSEINTRMQHAHTGNVAKDGLKAHAIVGTPNQCIQRIGEYMDIGVDRFMLSFPEAATDINGIRLFAEQVLPSFQ